MTELRIEKDLLGELGVPKNALYGIHTARAMENFPLSGRKVHPELIRAFGAVKLACAHANQELSVWPEKKAQAIFTVCQEMADGKLSDHVLVDALQGGAGTSTNMNINEVLANRALQILGRPLGEYETVSPLADINLHQSTNDTYPTALKVAAIILVRKLSGEVALLQEAFQEKEKDFAGVVKVGRTQFQDAVLITLGREMASYAEALGRDRWRLYKCEERLRVVNLGGTAVGTGISAPRSYIFSAVEHLKQITGIGLARAENLVECTQNADVFVEVSGIVKAHAASLIKVASDLRFLSSGPAAGIGEIRLPPRQAGSSLMPGKVNPVILEAVTQAAILTMANDQAIAFACCMGHLELNPFLPLMADALLGSLWMLTQACLIFRRFCVQGITADRARCRELVEQSGAGLTALVEAIGYEAAEQVALAAGQSGKTIREAACELNLLAPEEFDRLIGPARVLRLGFDPSKAGK